MSQPFPFPRHAKSPGMGSGHFSIELWFSGGRAYEIHYSPFDPATVLRDRSERKTKFPLSLRPRLLIIERVVVGKGCMPLASIRSPHSRSLVQAASATATKANVLRLNVS
jgi:hypothetical protein